jgi:hypothetical protein
MLDWVLLGMNGVGWVVVKRGKKGRWKERRAKGRGECVSVCMIPGGVECTIW